jgi:hypothetical protein
MIFTGSSVETQKFPKYLFRRREMRYNGKESPWDFSFLLLFSF